MFQCSTYISFTLVVTMVAIGGLEQSTSVSDIIFNLV